MKQTIRTGVGIATGTGTAKAISSTLTIAWEATVDAPIVVQAILERIGEAHEGSLVRSLEPAWAAITRALAMDSTALHSLTARQWEELIAASYDKAGYDEVILTPRSGDFGRDVIAVRKGWGSVRIIDQVKAYTPGHVVTANDVRALLGVLGADRNATKGVVTTTSTFAPRISTDPFIAPYLPYRLELIDGPALIDRFRKLSSTGSGD